MCKEYSAVFIITMVLAYVGLFSVTLLNMIFSIKASNKRNAFKEYYFPEFHEKMKRSFIMDLEFEEGAEDKDLYGEYRRDKIYKWRNNTMKKTYQTFEIELLKDIISFQESCREGYKKCGTVNEYGQALCLKLNETEKCPINNIIIDESGLKPSGDYKQFNLGNKSVYFSTEETSKFILTNLSISEDIKNIEGTNLDSETLKELCKYNSDLWSAYCDYLRLVYLNGEYYELPEKDTFEDLIKEYEKREKFDNSKITEMNKKVKDYKGTILFLGIFTFIITVIIPLDIGTFYLFKNNDCDKRNSYGEVECTQEKVSLCLIPCYGLLYCFFRYSCTPCFRRELDQKRLSITLFLIFLPVLICNIIGLIIGFIKKVTYNDYLAMELINDYKNGNSLDNSLKNINRVIILNIVNLIIFVVYSLICFVSNKLREDDSIAYAPNTAPFTPNNDIYTPNTVPPSPYPY